MRAVAPVSVLAAAALALLGGPGRIHRLHRPTPPLPTSVSVDLTEWSVIPSHTVVAAGAVTFHVYDRGMDAHNLTVQGPGRTPASGRVLGLINLQSGASGTIVARLERGTYLLYCDLFLGTPMSHYMKGMHTLLRVG